MEEGYEEVKELKQLSPEIILAWKEDYSPPIYLVRKQVMCQCPQTNELVPESKCRSCPHCFGDASPREIYCLPKTKKIIGTRTLRRKEKERLHI